MIFIALIAGVLVLAAFVVLVVGVRSTDRQHGLCDPEGDGLAQALARRVLGVYVRQTADHGLGQDQNHCHGQVRR
jgi:hypothetical protein